MTFLSYANTRIWINPIRPWQRKIWASSHRAPSLQAKGSRRESATFRPHPWSHQDQSRLPLPLLSPLLKARTIKLNTSEVLERPEVAGTRGGAGPPLAGCARAGRHLLVLAPRGSEAATGGGVTPWASGETTCGGWRGRAASGLGPPRWGVCTVGAALWAAEVDLGCVEWFPSEEGRGWGTQTCIFSIERERRGGLSHWGHSALWCWALVNEKAKAWPNGHCTPNLWGAFAWMSTLWLHKLPPASFKSLSFKLFWWKPFLID
jgi:hypothetical protein